MATHRDVFISYSHNDSDWVKNTLLLNLEQRGFSVTIDFRDFRTGSLGISEMQMAVEDCRHTLLVMTPSYIKSAWSTFENAMVQGLDPDATWRRVIPILRETCTPPLRLSIIQYRDLRNNDPDEWDRLYRDLA